MDVQIPHLYLYNQLMSFWIVYLLANDGVIITLDSMLFLALQHGEVGGEDKHRIKCNDYTIIASKYTIQNDISC